MYINIKVTLNVAKERGSMKRINLINTRKSLGLTQIQLADKIEISTRYYQRLEAGTSNGSMKVWQKLKQVLNKSVDYLNN